MLIGTNWKIEADSLNVVLYRKHTGGKNPITGEIGKNIYWSQEGYYATLHGALASLVDNEIRDTKLEDVKYVCSKIDELYTLIQSITNITVADLKKARRIRKYKETKMEVQ